MSELRRCSYCGTRKPLSRFYNGKYDCKDCIRMGARPTEGCFSVRRVHAAFFTIHAPSYFGGYGRILATAITRDDANAVRKRLTREAMDEKNAAQVGRQRGRKVS